MSHTALSFEALAISNKVKYVVDNSSDTLIVDDINDVDLSEFVNLIKQYAYEKGIAKISVKVKEPSAIYFFQHGFKVEASIYLEEKEPISTPMITRGTHLLVKSQSIPPFLWCDLADIIEVTTIVDSEVPIDSGIATVISIFK